MMKPTFALVLLTCGIGACTVMPQRETVRAGQSITTELIRLKAPDEGEWNVQKRLADSVAIAGNGPGPNSTIAAHAYLFKTLVPKEKEQFLQAVRKGLQQHNSNNPRFREIEAKFEYDGQRGYHCARHVTLVEDLQARAIGGGTRSLRMQTHSLYCAYQFEEGVLTVSGYSHRGDELMEGFDQRARKFIEGVTFHRRIG